MSVIFEGQDTTLDRKVAIKVLNEEYCNDEVRIQAFENEARLTAQVSHPNVVQVYETSKIEAYTLAATAGGWEIVSQTALALARTVDIDLPRPPEGSLWANHAKIAQHRGGDTLKVKLAGWHSALGALALSRSDRTKAEEHFKAERDIVEAELGPTHLAAGAEDLRRTRRGGGNDEPRGTTLAKHASPLPPAEG